MIFLPQDFAEQSSWAELAHWGGLSDQKIKKGTFEMVEKISFWESPVKFCEVLDSPNAKSYIPVWARS